jgi:hypothetical protein
MEIERSVMGVFLSEVQVNTSFSVSRRRFIVKRAETENDEYCQEPPINA